MSQTGHSSGAVLGAAATAQVLVFALACAGGSEERTGAVEPPRGFVVGNVPRYRSPAVEFRQSAGATSAEPSHAAGTGGAGVSPAANAGTSGAEETGEGGAGGDGGTIPDICGDGRRHPIHEACDPGADGLMVGCTAGCRVQATVVRADKSRARVLGLGPHPIAVSDRGSALVYVTPGAGDELRLVSFAGDGAEKDAVTIDATSVSDSADPVVVGLPDGSFAVAYTSYGSATTGLDVRLVRVFEGDPQLAAAFPGDSAVGAQRNADMIVLDDRVVVAWTDGFSDVLAREFDFDLEPLGPVIPVAVSEELEDAPVLAQHGETWYAAFRQNSDAGERIGVFADGEVHFTEPLPAALEAERPALAAIGEGQLLVVHGSIADEHPDGQRSELLAFAFNLELGTIEQSVASRAEGGSRHLPSLSWMGQRLLLAFQSEEREASGVERSRAYVRELGTTSGGVVAGPERLLAGEDSRASSASVRVVASESLLGFVWNELEEGHEEPEIHRLSYPLPLGDDALYAETLPTRVQ